MTKQELARTVRDTLKTKFSPARIVAGGYCLEHKAPLLNPGFRVTAPKGRMSFVEVRNERDELLSIRTWSKAPGFQYNPEFRSAWNRRLDIISKYKEVLDASDFDVELINPPDRSAWPYLKVQSKSA